MFTHRSVVDLSLNREQDTMVEPLPPLPLAPSEALGDLRNISRKNWSKSAENLSSIPAVPPLPPSPSSLTGRRAPNMPAINTKMAVQKAKIEQRLRLHGDYWAVPDRGLEARRVCF